MAIKHRESRNVCGSESAADSQVGTPAEGTHTKMTPVARGGGLVVVLNTPDAPASVEAKSSAAVDERILDRRTQAAIGQQLRAFYNDIATEPVPNRLLELLEELELKSGGSSP